MRASLKSDLFQRVETALDTVRPHLRADGGDVELVDITDNFIAQIKWHGACKTCHMTQMTMKAGLEANRKVAVINGISLEPHKLESILSLAVAYDVDIIGYLLDERSQMPPNQDDRMAIALELFQRCLAAGLRPEQLILDPVVAPLIWQDGLQRNRDLLEIIRRLPELLDFPVRTVAGLSNLTTGQKALGPKQRLEQTYLSMLASAGLSWVLLDILHHETVTSAKIGRMLLRDDIFAWDTWSTMTSPDDHDTFST